MILNLWYNNVTGNNSVAGYFYNWRFTMATLPITRPAKDKPLDEVGAALKGLTHTNVINIAQGLGIDTNKYLHLNIGMQRMNIGVKIRNIVKNNADLLTTVQNQAEAMKAA
jgi:hypothetical protein